MQKLKELINQADWTPLPIRTVFNMPEAGTAQIPGLALRRDDVPAINPNYEFELQRMRDMTMFWVSGFRACLIEGDPAAGKTSFVTEWHARLNVPLYIVPCGPDTERYQLIGQLLPGEDGKLVWRDGPLLMAYREGSSVLLDEYNTLDAGISNGINLLLECKPFTIPETGETVQAGKTTRIFVTQNSVDSAAAVTGRNIQDVANDDRFFYMEVDYIKPEQEEAIVVKELMAGNVPQAYAEQIAKVLVLVATKARKAFRDSVEAIEFPISTRVVIRWAMLAVLYKEPMRKEGKSGMHYALQRSRKMPRAMATALNDYLTAVVGFDENLVTAGVAA